MTAAAMIPGSAIVPDGRFHYATSAEIGPPTVTIPLVESANPPSYEVTLRDDTGWTKSKERQFTDLLTLKALKRATPDELVKFRELQARRRRLKNPIKADEIIFQFKKQQMASKLLNDIQAYINFTQCRV
jgi:hypothetical protein